MFDKKQLLEFLYDQSILECTLDEKIGLEYVRAYGKVAQHFCSTSPTIFYSEVKKRLKCRNCKKRKSFVGDF